jgi:hypothetical protein
MHYSGKRIAPAIAKFNRFFTSRGSVHSGISRVVISDESRLLIEARHLPFRLCPGARPFLRSIGFGGSKAGKNVLFALTP